MRTALPSLTGLRFIAAFSILLAHAVGDLHVDIAGLRIDVSSISFLGMPLFFVLSGFVIHYNYAKLFSDSSTAEACTTFMVARFARLYPLFLAVLIFTLWAERLWGFWVRMNRAELLSFSYLLNIFSWYPIWLENMLLIQHRFGVAWSISTEWFFYVAYCFFAAALTKASLRQTGMILVVLSALAYGYQLFGTLHPDAIMSTLGIEQPAGVELINSSYRWLY